MNDSPVLHLKGLHKYRASRSLFQVQAIRPFETLGAFKNGLSRRAMCLPNGIAMSVTYF
jgi:hypothetical protein